MDADLRAAAAARLLRSKSPTEMGFFERRINAAEAGDLVAEAELRQALGIETPEDKALVAERYRPCELHGSAGGWRGIDGACAKCLQLPPAQRMPRPAPLRIAAALARGHSASCWLARNDGKGWPRCTCGLSQDGRTGAIAPLVAAFDLNQQPPRVVLLNSNLARVVESLPRHRQAIPTAEDPVFMNPLDALRQFVSSLPKNAVVDGAVGAQFRERLVAAWGYLAGSKEQLTSADMLDRAEQLTWEPPFVTFVLERHFWQLEGRSRAELHHWVVNVDTGTADIKRTGYRQVSPNSPKIDTKRLATETAQRIVAGEEHHSLEWRDNHTYVVILIGKLIPQTITETTYHRRKRFRAQIEEVMRQHGWTRRDRGNRIGFVRPESLRT